MIPGLLLAIGILFVAVAQSSAAPLFTLSAAAPAFAVLFLGILCVYRGATVAMVATPLVAIAEAWLRGLEPGLLLLAYVPVVPLIDYSRGMAQPVFGPGVRLVAMVLMVGAWCPV